MAQQDETYLVQTPMHRSKCKKTRANIYNGAALWQKEAARDSLEDSQRTCSLE